MAKENAAFRRVATAQKKNRTAAVQAASATASPQPQGLGSGAQTASPVGSARATLGFPRPGVNRHLGGHQQGAGPLADRRPPEQLAFRVGPDDQDLRPPPGPGPRPFRETVRVDRERLPS